MALRTTEFLGVLVVAEDDLARPSAFKGKVGELVALVAYRFVDDERHVAVRLVALVAVDV